MPKSKDTYRADKAKGSKSYEKAKSKAEEYVKDPEKLNDLIEKASKKANGKKGSLDAIWGQLMACFRLIKAYAQGTYRKIPWSSMVILVASVIYFVMPIDMIPDFIVAIGLLDDVALLGWAVKTFGSEVNAFVEWEKENTTERHT